MTNQEAIQMLKSKLDGSVDTSYEWCECVRLAINALETTDTQNSQELIYKKACGVDVEASIEAQKSWEQWREDVKAIQECERKDVAYKEFIDDISCEPIAKMREIKEGWGYIETEVEGLYLNFEQDGEPEC